MNIASVIIAGGLGTRLGAPEKPLVSFRGRPLLDALIERIAPQVSALALNIRPDAEDAYKSWRLRGFPCLADPFAGEAGPLGGVVAGLEWASSHGADWLATFPADTPFLPRNLVRSLAASIDKDATAPVVAVGETRIEGLCALWPVASLTRLQAGVENGTFRSAWYTLSAFNAIHCRIETPYAFFNINTAEDLAEAERIAAGPDLAG